MGLLRLAQFSSIPDLSKKISARTQSKEVPRSDFMQWLMLNATRIIRHRDVDASNVAQSIYTVPAGSIFFLTSAQIDFNATVTSAGRLQDDEGNRIVQLFLVGTTPNGKTASVPFAIPLRFDEGESINAFRTSGGLTGHITGYEVERSKLLY